jgi:hypothetical protein
VRLLPPGDKRASLPALRGTTLPSTGVKDAAVIPCGDGGASRTQAGSTVAGNQVAGDYNQTIFNEAGRDASVVERLLARLQAELDNDITCSDTIRKLQRYHGGTSKGGVIGLRNKLMAGGRGDEIEDALEQKEMFVKLLEEFSLYASAQEIFVYLLAQAERVFNSEILPLVGELNAVEINRQTNRLILDPVVQECGATVFQIDHLTAMGMLYWLAEQCFVRWH